MVKGPAADATDAPQTKAFCATPVMKMKMSRIFLTKFYN
jgi:hypothetical protein